MPMNRALFLDRDGVINVNHGYVHKPCDFEFIDGIFDVCSAAQNLGYLLVVVTNQAGIGRGYYTKQDFLTLTDWMSRQFLAQGIVIKKVYFCPYHPEYGLGEFKRESEFRKPAPGMILQACQELDIDPSISILVGDKPSDIAAGRSAGLTNNILFDSDNVFNPAENLINHLGQLKNWL